MGAIDNVKEVAKLIKDIGNMELYQKILDLQGEIMELTQENRDLQKNLQEVQDKLSQVDKMKFVSPFYYAEGDKVPYCPRCWEVDKKAIHFREPYQSGVGPCYECPECKNQINHPSRR